MCNIIDINEKRNQYKEKRAAEKKQIEKEMVLKSLILDMETILYMISKGEIIDIDMVFKFRDIDCYYGYREELDREAIKNRINGVDKHVKFLEEQ